MSQGEDEVNTTRPSSSLSGLINNNSFYKNRQAEKSNNVSALPKPMYQIPDKEYRVIGLDNPKNWCYMNAVIQALLSIKEFRYYFYFKEYSSITYATYFQKKIYCNAVSKLFKEMLELEEEYAYIKPSFFHNIVEKRFNADLQQDAHEFLIHVLS